MKADVDPIRVRELLGHINESGQRLRELARQSRADFLADYRNTESAKYLFIVAAEAAIDICNHIVARAGGRAPNSYADCFAALADLGVFSSVLAEQLQPLARFRNLLVHRYGEVSDERVYEIMHHDLGTLDSFRNAIAKWLER